MKFYILLFITALSLCPAMAQEMYIKGHLLDQETKIGIEGATITISDKDTHAISDKNGDFTIMVSGLPVKLQIQHLSFQTKEVTVKEAEVSIEMVPAIRRLNEIMVKESEEGVIWQKTGNELLKHDHHTDIGDLFSNLPGFGVIKRGGFAMEPVLRSFKYEQINLIYDGGLFISPACPNRMDPVTTHVPTDEVKKIEIIKGPYNVRYGQAMGGVINIVTETPKYTGSRVVGGHANTGYVGNGNGFFGGLGLDIANQNKYLNLSGSFQDFDNYVSGSGQEIASAYHTADYSIKTGWYPDKNKKLQLTFRQSFAWDVLHAGLPMDTDSDQSTVAILDYEGNFGKSANKFWRTKLYWAHVDHVMSNANRPNFMMVEATSPVQSNTIGGRFELEWIFDNSSVFAGADLRYIGKEGNRERLIKRNMMTGEPLEMPMLMTDKIWQNSHQSTTGLFVEMEKDIAQFNWKAGLRGNLNQYNALDVEDDFAAEYGNDFDKQMNSFNMFSSLTYALNNAHQLSGAIGWGSRAPELVEMYINHFTVGMDAYEYIGNPNLEIESNLQFDLAYRYKNKKIEGYANIFYSKLGNYIMGRVDTTLSKKFMPSKPPTAVKRFTNVPDAYQVGFDWELKWHLSPNISLVGGQFYTYAQNESWNEPLAEIPPLTSRWEVQFNKNKWNAGFGSKLCAEQDRVAPSFDETTTPGYVVYHAFVSFQPTKHWHFYVKADNITNVEYVDHLSRPYKNMSENSLFFEPGRQIRLNLKYTF